MTPKGNASNNPYIGPRAFHTGEHLYGRERESRQLINLIVAERMVLLYSPSGAGKTSLIQAAIIPQLSDMMFHVLPTIRLSLVSSDKMERGRIVNPYTLSTLLSLEAELPQSEQTPHEKLTILNIAEYLDQRPKPKNGQEFEVLIFDQFEEILTSSPTDLEAKQEFFRQLGDALGATNRWALFSMREDYVPALDPYLLNIPNRLSTTLRLDLLDRESAKSAIQQPTKESGCEFEDPAADRLVDDLRKVRIQQEDGTLKLQLGPYIEPVQLQVVCHRLWEIPRQEPDRITEADITAIGKVDQSLVDQSLAEYYAQRIRETADVTGTSERSIREWVDHQLITELGVRGNVLMGPVYSNGLDNRDIKILIDAHLVRAEKRGGATWFELAHDRLIAPIREDNASWLSTNLSLFQKQASLWERQGRPARLLLRGREMAEADQWATEYKDRLTPAEVEFHLACRSLFNQERRARRLTWAISVLGIVAIVLGIMAIILANNYYQANLIAEQQTRAAITGELAANSQAMLSGSPALSMLLAVESISVIKDDEPRPPSAEEALRATLKETHGYPLPGHSGPVNAVSISQNGNWLATGGDDRTVLLWHLSGEGPEGDPVILNDHTGSITTLAFSGDGRWLATGSDDKTTRLWRLDSTGIVGDPAVLTGHDGAITSLAFSDDGKMLATGSEDGSALIWDLSAPDPSMDPDEFVSQEGWIQTLAISPDGRWLATGGPVTVELWDLQSRASPPVFLPGHKALVLTLAFSQEGDWLATGGKDNLALLWDLNSADLGKEPVILDGHLDWVNSLAFSPDAHWLATGSGDRTAQLWDLNAPDPSDNPVVLSGHEGAITILEFSSDGRRLATGSTDHTIRVWNLASDNSIPAVDPQVLNGHSDSVNALDFSQDGHWLLTGSEDATVRLWDLANLDPATNPIELLGHADAVKSLAFRPDTSMLATGGNDQAVLLWNLTGAVEIQRPESLSDHTGGINVLAYSPDGSWLATGSADHTTRLWDLNQSDLSKASKLLARHTGPVTAISFSPDGRWLATGSEDQTALLWDLETRDPSESPKVLTGHRNRINALAFNPDGHWLVTVSDDSTARAWDMESPDPDSSSKELTGHRDGILALTFSPDGNWMATGSRDRSVRLWRMGTTGPELESIELAVSNQVLSLGFSPDGRLLAAGSMDGQVYLWDLEAVGTSSQAVELSGHEDWVTSLVFSPDYDPGSYLLATGSADQTARLWYLETLNSYSNSVRLAGHLEPVNALAFSQDGKWLATGSDDNSVLLWLVNLEDLKNLACQSAGRNLSRDEWQQYFQDQNYRKTCEEWPEGR